MQSIEALQEKERLRLIEVEDKARKDRFAMESELNETRKQKDHANVMIEHLQNELRRSRAVGSNPEPIRVGGGGGETSESPGWEMVKERPSDVSTSTDDSMEVVSVTNHEPPFPQQSDSPVVVGGGTPKATAREGGAVRPAQTTTSAAVVEHPDVSVYDQMEQQLFQASGDGFRQGGVSVDSRVHDPMVYGHMGQGEPFPLGGSHMGVGDRPEGSMPSFMPSSSSSNNSSTRRISKRNGSRGGGSRGESRQSTASVIESDQSYKDGGTSLDAAFSFQMGGHPSTPQRRQRSAGCRSRQGGPPPTDRQTERADLDWMDHQMFNTGVTQTTTADGTKKPQRNPSGKKTDAYAYENDHEGQRVFSQTMVDSRPSHTRQTRGGGRRDVYGNHQATHERMEQHALPPAKMSGEAKALMQGGGPAVGGFGQNALPPRSVYDMEGGDMAAADVVNTAPPRPEAVQKGFQQRAVFAADHGGRGVERSRSSFGQDLGPQSQFQLGGMGSANNVAIQRREHVNEEPMQHFTGLKGNPMVFNMRQSEAGSTYIERDTVMGDAPVPHASYANRDIGDVMRGYSTNNQSVQSHFRHVNPLGEDQFSSGAQMTAPQTKTEATLERHASAYIMKQNPENSGWVNRVQGAPTLPQGDYAKLGETNYSGNKERHATYVREPTPGTTRHDQAALRSDDPAGYDKGTHRGGQLQDYVGAPSATQGGMEHPRPDGSTRADTQRSNMEQNYVAAAHSKDQGQGRVTDGQSTQLEQNRETNQQAPQVANASATGAGVYAPQEVRLAEHNTHGIMGQQSQQGRQLGSQFLGLTQGTREGRQDQFLGQFEPRNTQPQQHGFAGIAASFTTPLAAQESASERPNQPVVLNNPHLRGNYHVAVDRASIVTSRKPTEDLNPGSTNMPKQGYAVAPELRHKEGGNEAIRVGGDGRFGQAYTALAPHVEASNRQFHVTQRLVKSGDAQQAVRSAQAQVRREDDRISGGPINIRAVQKTYAPAPINTQEPFIDFSEDPIVGRDISGPIVKMQAAAPSVTLALEDTTMIRPGAIEVDVKRPAIPGEVRLADHTTTETMGRAVSHPGGATALPVGPEKFYEGRQNHHEDPSVGMVSGPTQAPAVSREGIEESMRETNRETTTISRAGGPGHVVDAPNVHAQVEDGEGRSGDLEGRVAGGPSGEAQGHYITQANLDVKDTNRGDGTGGQIVGHAVAQEQQRGNYTMTHAAVSSEEIKGKKAPLAGRIGAPTSDRKSTQFYTEFWDPSMLAPPTRRQVEVDQHQRDQTEFYQASEYDPSRHNSLHGAGQEGEETKKSLLVNMMASRHHPDIAPSSAPMRFKHDDPTRAINDIVKPKKTRRRRRRTIEMEPDGTMVTRETDAVTDTETGYGSDNSVSSTRTM